MLDKILPPVGYNFELFFFNPKTYIPNLLDIRFQSVSGISTNIVTETMNQGGQTIFSQKIPTRVEYPNLVLKRGMAIGSFLVSDLKKTFQEFKFSPVSILVILHSDVLVPIASWKFEKAYPVKWEMSDLNAEEDKLIIENIEFVHSGFSTYRL